MRGLSDHGSGEVWMHKPKTLESAMEKARLVEENLALAAGGATRGQTASAPVTLSVARGSQPQTSGFPRIHPSYFESG